MEEVRLISTKNLHSCTIFYFNNQSIVSVDKLDNNGECNWECIIGGDEERQMTGTLWFNHNKLVEDPDFTFDIPELRIALEFLGYEL